MVESVNYRKGIALVLLQNEMRSEMPLFLAAGAVAWLEKQGWEIKIS